jgi:hypothetical protein
VMFQTQTSLHSIVFCFCVWLCVSQFWYVKYILTFLHRKMRYLISVFWLIVPSRLSPSFHYHIVHLRKSTKKVKHVLDNFVTSQWFNKMTASSVTLQIWNYSFLVV